MLAAYNAWLAASNAGAFNGSGFPIFNNSADAYAYFQSESEDYRATRRVQTIYYLASDFTPMIAWQVSRDDTTDKTLSNSHLYGSDEQWLEYRSSNSASVADSTFFLSATDDTFVYYTAASAALDPRTATLPRTGGWYEADGVIYRYYEYAVGVPLIANAQAISTID